VTFSRAAPLAPNFAGKTSILQVPLLLKQTFDSPKCTLQPDRTLNLNLVGPSREGVPSSGGKT